MLKRQRDQALQQEYAYYHQGSIQLDRQRDQVGQKINAKAEEIRMAPYSGRTPEELGNYYKTLRNELKMMEAEYDALGQESATKWKGEEENRDWQAQKEFEAAWEDPNFSQIAQTGEEKGYNTLLNRRLLDIAFSRREGVKTPFLEERITDAEKATYYYYIGQRDTFTANEYLEQLNRRWQREGGEEMAQRIAQEEGVKKYADLFGTGAVSSLQGAGNSVAQVGKMFTDDGDPVAPGVFEVAVEELNEQLPPLERGALNLGRGVTDAALTASVAKMLKLLGPVKGSLTGSLGAGGYKYLESYRDSMNKNPNSEEASRKA
ncbi:MAG: hypothetical protein EOM66_12340, partial [Clostridia bacterium]|nr:hypothetical protein [Clostridia bacterium]